MNEIPLLFVRFSVKEPRHVDVRCPARIAPVKARDYCRYNQCRNGAGIVGSAHWNARARLGVLRVGSLRNCRHDLYRKMSQRKTSTGGSVQAIHRTPGSNTDGPCDKV